MRVRRIEDFKCHSNKGRTLVIAIKVREVSGSGNTPRSMKHWTEKLLPWIGGLKYHYLGNWCVDIICMALVSWNLEYHYLGNWCVEIPFAWCCLVIGEVEHLRWLQWWLAVRTVRPDGESGLSLPGISSSLQISSYQQTVLHQPSRPVRRRVTKGGGLTRSDKIYA